MTCNSMPSLRLRTADSPFAQTPSVLPHTGILASAPPPAIPAVQFSPASIEVNCPEEWELIKGNILSKQYEKTK